MKNEERRSDDVVASYKSQVAKDQDLISVLCNLKPVTCNNWIGLFCVLAIFCDCLPVFADTVWLTNGRKIEGRIVDDGESDEIEVRVGDHGTMRIKRSNIVKTKEAERTHIDLYASEGNTLYVNATLNDEKPVKLIVDSGAGGVIVSREVFDSLGIPMDPEHGQTGPVKVADGRTVNAFYFYIDSLSVGKITARRVEAAVFLEEEPTMKEMGDGLLGMSFLGRFHMTLDRAGKKLILENQSFEAENAVDAEPSEEPAPECAT